MSLNTIRSDLLQWKFGEELLPSAVFSAETTTQESASAVRHLVAGNRQSRFRLTRGRLSSEQAQVWEVKGQRWGVHAGQTGWFSVTSQRKEILRRNLIRNFWGKNIFFNDCSVKTSIYFVICNSTIY